MKKLLLSLALLLIAGPAFANPWYFVNIHDKSQPDCIVMKQSPREFIAEMQAQFGADKVTTYPETHEDGSKFIGIVVEGTEGPAQLPIADSLGTCRKVMGNVVKVEAILAEQRQNIADPWFFMAAQFQECVQVSSIFKGINTPESYADFAARNKRPVNIQYNADQTIALLKDNSGDGNPIAMVHGHDLCVIAMKLTNDK